MKAVVVQYEVKPEFVEQNAGNIRAVMEELANLADAEIRYQAFQTADNSAHFTHIGFYANQGAQDRATALESFKRFQSALKASGPVTPPNARWLDLVGSGHEIF